MYLNFLIHSCAEGHLGCFHVPAVVNGASVNIGVHVSLLILVASGCMPSSGIAGSHGSFSYASFCKLISCFFEGMKLHLSLPCNSGDVAPFSFN